MRRKTEREINGIKVFKHNFNKEDIIKPFRCSNGSLYYKDTFWWTNDGYLVKVIEYYDKNNILIEFLYNGYRRYVKLSELICGAIRNPYHLNKFGGYFGTGKYGKRSHIKIYNSWSKMLERNSIEGQLSNKRNRSYINCSIYREWYNYQNFAIWYDNYRSNINLKYWDILELDKDILQWNQTYKIYGPNTCCLVPNEINQALTNMHTKSTLNKGLPPGIQTKYNRYEVAVCIRGKLTYGGHYDTPEEAFEVYKQIKSEYIRELADFYYNEGAIYKEIYDTLYNLEIIPLVQLENI